jgi:hypothetical protein
VILYLKLLFVEEYYNNIYIPFADGLSLATGVLVPSPTLVDAVTQNS